MTDLKGSVISIAMEGFTWAGLTIVPRITKTAAEGVFP